MLTDTNPTEYFQSFYVVTVHDPHLADFVGVVKAPSADYVRDSLRHSWLEAINLGQESFQFGSARFCTPMDYKRPVATNLTYIHTEEREYYVSCTLPFNRVGHNTPGETMMPGAKYIWYDPEGKPWLFNDSMVSVENLWSWVAERRVDLVGLLDVEDIPAGAAYPERQLHISITPIVKP